eukprot:3579039-Rhodomonas_salina.1
MIEPPMKPGYEQTWDGREKVTCPYLAKLHGLSVKDVQKIHDAMNVRELELELQNELADVVGEGKEVR